MVIDNVDGLVQNHSKSSALVMELLQFCTKQSIWILNPRSKIQHTPSSVMHA